MNIERVFVTPEMATEWLRHNHPKNRKLDRRTVSEYARLMKSGDFYETSDTIRFDTNGTLIDGQHRLSAIVEANVKRWMWVSYNNAPETMLVIDTQRPRKLEARLSMAGAFEDEPKMRYSQAHATIRSLVRNGYKSNIKLGDPEIIKLIEAFKEELVVVMNIAGKKSGSNAHINAAALSALLNGEPAEDIYAFFRVFLKSETDNRFGYNISAALNLSRTFLESKAKHNTINAARLYPLTQNAIWNFLRGDRTTKYLKVPKTDRYPVADKIKKVLEG